MSKWPHEYRDKEKQASEKSVVEGNLRFLNPIGDYQSCSDHTPYIEEFLGSLSGREKLVLELRFGISDGRGRTLEEIGRMLGLTRERIRQIERKALEKLRGMETIGHLKELIA